MSLGLYLMSLKMEEGLFLLLCYSGGGNWKLFRITYNKTDSKMNQNKS